MNPRAWTAVQPGPGVHPPAGAYSPVAKAGPFIFLSGQVPKHPGTGAMVEGDVAEQTRVVLENSRALLEAAGASLDDVVAVTAYLADMGDWQAFDDVYRSFFSGPRPTRTTVGAELRGIRVEITMVAYVPG